MPLKPEKVLLQRFFLGFRVAASAAVLSYLFLKVDWARAFGLIPQLNLVWGMLAWLFLHASLLVMSTRWAVLLRWLGVAQRVRDSWRYYLVGSFYSVLLPGVVGGDVVRIGLSVGERGEGKILTASSVLFERICGLLTLVVIAAVALSLDTEQVQLNPEFVASLQILGVVAIVLLLSGSFIARFFLSHPSCGTNKDGLFSRLRGRLHPFSVLNLYKISILILLTGLGHLLSFASAYGLSEAMGLGLSFRFFVVVMPAVFIATVLPVSLGGIGIREGVLTFFLVQKGVPATESVVLALLVYLTMILVGLTGAVVEFGWLGRKAGRGPAVV